MPIPNPDYSEARGTLVPIYGYHRNQGSSKLDKAQWEFDVNESSNQVGAGVGVVLSSLEGVELEYSARLDFLTLNDVAEDEALVLGLQLFEMLSSS